MNIKSINESMIIDQSAAVESLTKAVISSDVAQVLKDLDEQIKTLKKAQDDLLDMVLKVMTENAKEQLTSDVLTIKYNAPSVSLRLDTTKLKTEQPDLYKSYLKETAVKAFLKVDFAKEPKETKDDNAA